MRMIYTPDFVVRRPVPRGTRRRSASRSAGTGRTKLTRWFPPVLITATSSPPSQLVEQRRRNPEHSLCSTPEYTPPPDTVTIDRSGIGKHSVRGRAAPVRARTMRFPASGMLSFRISTVSPAASALRESSRRRTRALPKSGLPKRARNEGESQAPPRTDRDAPRGRMSHSCL